MKIRVSKLGEAKRYEFMDGAVFVRQFPASMSIVEGNVEGFVRIAGAQQQAAFVHCLTKWENFKDEAGDDVKLTDELKKTLFDYPDPDLAHEGEQLVQFVLRRGKVIAEETEEEAGN